MSSARGALNPEVRIVVTTRPPPLQAKALELACLLTLEHAQKAPGHLLRNEYKTSIRTESVTLPALPFPCRRGVGWRIHRPRVLGYRHLKGIAMSLARLVAFVEDGPWCGTALVHPAHPGRLERPLAFHVVNEVALNPQPLPPHPEIAARLWQAIRLHQYAHMLATDKRNVALEESLSHAAVGIYDDWDMPKLPWMIVLRWLGRPPPPPSYPSSCWRRSAVARCLTTRHSSRLSLWAPSATT